MESIRWLQAYVAFLSSAMATWPDPAVVEIGLGFRQAMGWPVLGDEPSLCREASSVRVLQQELRDGLDAMQSEAGWSWPITRVVRVRTGSTPGALAIVGLGDVTDERSAILQQFLGLLQLHGDRLRRCDECQRWFIRQARQLYCRPSCGMRVRNRRRIGVAPPWQPKGTID